MELKFNSNGGAFIAEFVATSDFNLHIEGVNESEIVIYQRGSESGQYAFVRGAKPYPSYGKVYDFDFVGAVYPKYIMVKSEVEPTLAVVTSAGEVTEVSPSFGKFSIKIHEFGSGDSVIPTDTPAIEYELPKEDATWQDVIAANEAFYVGPYDNVLWRHDGEDYIISSEYKDPLNMGEVAPTDKVIKDKEYLAIA